MFQIKSSISKLISSSSYPAVLIFDEDGNLLYRKIKNDNPSKKITEMCAVMVSISKALLEKVFNEKDFDFTIIKSDGFQIIITEEKGYCVSILVEREVDIEPHLDFIDELKKELNV